MVLFVRVSVAVCLLWLAAERYSERDATRLIAKQLGVPSNVKTPAGTYCDLVTDRYAIEVEWPRGSKPYEAVGQSLHYAIELSREPAICFLVYGRDLHAIEHVRSRVSAVCARHGIKVFVYDLRAEKLWKLQ